MLKRILIATVMAGAFAAVATASILLDVGAYEQGLETPNYIDTLDMAAKATDLPHQAVADPI